MSNKTIADYTAANSIDAANDYLLIEPNGNTVYKKINRNVLLGLSSAPLGTTDSQSPTNKTFDNTNTITVKDGGLTIQNSSSATKQAVFSAASITAGQTRTFTFPDASGTIATIAGTQTLTNKTITGPTITGGTYDNGTITVDSIAGHSVSTTGTVYGLAITTGTIATAGIAANAVTSTKIASFDYSNTAISNPYKFSVYRNAALTLTSGAFTKVTYDTELFDTNNNFATGTYTVPVSGFYWFSAHFQSTATASNTRSIASIFKNGSETLRGNDITPTSGSAMGCVVAGLLQLAASDTVEIRVDGIGANVVVDVSSQALNYFMGYLVSQT